LTRLRVKKVMDIEGEADSEEALGETSEVAEETSEEGSEVAEGTSEVGSVAVTGEVSEEGSVETSEADSEGVEVTSEEATGEEEDSHVVGLKVSIHIVLLVIREESEELTLIKRENTSLLRKMIDQLFN